MEKAKVNALTKRVAIEKYTDISDLFKALAMDVGKEVAHHIETMYPEAVKAASSTFLLSVRNCTYNNIMAAAKVNDESAAVALLARRAWFRRKVKAAYRKIRQK